MVDIAKVRLAVDTADLKKGEQALNQLDRAGKKVEAQAERTTAELREQGQAMNRLERQTEDTTSELRQQEQALNKLNRAERQVEQQIENTTSELRKQEHGLDRVDHAQTRLGQQVDKTSIELKQQEREFNRLNRTEIKVEQQLRRTSTEMRQQGAAARSMGSSTQVAGGNVGNLTAQFNDIGLMLASGQSPLLLAAQQGTQVAQVLNQMGKDVGVVKSLGLAFRSFLGPVQLATFAIIAGGAALGQWALQAAKTKFAIQSLAGLMEQLEEEVEAFSNATDDAISSNKDLEETYGSLGTAMGPYLDRLREMANLQAQIKAQDFADALTGIMGESVFGRLNPFRDRAFETFGVGMADSRLREAEQLRGQLKLEETAEARFAILQKIYKLTEELIKADGEVTDKEKEIEKALLDQLKIEGQLVGVAERRLNTKDKQKAREERDLKTAQKMLASMEQEELVQKAITKYGGQSAEVTKIRQDYERQLLEIKLSQLQVEEELREVIVEQFEARIRATKEAQAAEAQRAEAQKQLEGVKGVVGGISEVWADFVVRGFDRFKDFADQVYAVFQKLLAKMVAEAAAKRILIGIGLGGGVGGALAGGGGIGGALGGLAGGAIGGLGAGSGGFLNTFGSTLASQGLGMAGITSAVGTGLVSSFGGVGAGLGSSLMQIGGGNMLGALNIANTAGLVGGGLGATIGAAIPVIGAFVGAVGILDKLTGGGIFGGKTRMRDQGLQLDASGGQLEAQGFANFKRKGGLFSSTKRWTEYTQLPDESVDSLRKAYETVFDSVKEQAKIFGESANVLDTYTTSVKVSLKGLSDEERGKKIEETFSNISNEMAKMALEAGGFSTSLEDATATLLQVSSAVNAVNDMLQAVGQQRLEAQDAFNLAGRFGGGQQFSSALQGYYTSLYSDQEQADQSRTNIRGAIGTLPSTIQAYRKLAESQDLTTESGQALYTTMIQMAPAFAQLKQYEERLAEERRRAAEALRQQIAAMQQQQQALRYDSAFFSRGEIMSNLREDLGRYADMSREELRERILGINLTTESGRELFETLQDVAGKFTQLRSLEEQVEAERRAAAEAAAAEAARLAEQQRREAEALQREIERLQGRQTQLRYSEQLFDQGEIMANIMQDLGDTARLSTQEFRRQLLAIDLTTESGRDLYQTMTNLMPQFLQLRKYEEQIAAAREQQTEFGFDSRFYLPRDIEDNIQANLLSVFRDLNLSMPGTREEFRSLVEGADLATQSGRDLFAALLGIADQFVQVTDDIRGLNDELEGFQALFVNQAQEVFARNTTPQEGMGLSAGSPGVQALIHAINQGDIRIIRELVDLRTETARNSYNPTQETVDLST